jgi:hypothetical protein
MTLKYAKAEDLFHFLHNLKIMNLRAGFDPSIATCEQCEYTCARRVIDRQFPVCQAVEIIWISADVLSIFLWLLPTRVRTCYGTHMHELVRHLVGSDS